VITALLDDARLASSALRKRPGLVAIAILTLGLGIGVSTTLYALFLPQLYEMPPVRDPARLSVLFKTNPVLGIERGRPTHEEAIEWGASSRTFERFAAIGEGDATIAAGGEARRVSTHRVSVEYFETIGVKPALGRTFLPDEHTPIEKPVAVISHGLWRALFQKDPAIAGRAVEVGDEPYTIVGVMPEGFWFAFPGVDVWLPLSSELAATAARAHVFVAGRRRADASWEQAQAEIDTLTARLTPRDAAAGWRTSVVPMPKEATKRVRVAAAVALPALGILLIACVNVANLLLASGAGRAREMAVRSAIGATRPRMVRQLFVESIGLAAGGWLAGLFLTYWGVAGLRSLISQSQPEFAARIVVAPSVFAVALVMAAVTPMVFGLIPALRAASPNVGALLKDRAAGERTVRGYRLRDLLVPLQLALAVVLLVTAGMFVRFMWEQVHLPRGFDDRGVYVVDVVPRAGVEAGGAEAIPPGVETLLAEVIRAVPGVSAATVSNGLPTPGIGRGAHTVKLDEPGDAPSAGPRVASPMAVAPGFFEALGIPLVHGRDFSADDGPGGALMAIVSAHQARRWWPDRNPIGRSFTLEGRDAPRAPLTVVGVAGDVMSSPTLQAPFMYVPLRQRPSTNLLVSLRLATGRPDIAALKRAVAGVPPFRLDQIRSVRESLDSFLRGSDFVFWLFGGFAGLALSLAAIGVYTVVSQAVGARLREIGIRRAMGAGGADVLRAIFGPTFALCGVGIVLGAGGTLAVTRYTWDLLLTVSATSPVMWVVIVSALVVAGFAALVAPTRRVLRVDPAVVLRQN
jgi:predicted permease